LEPQLHGSREIIFKQIQVTRYLRNFQLSIII